MDTDAKAQIIRCPKCGTKNRVLTEKQIDSAPVCGRCKTILTDKVHPVIVTDRNFAEEIENSTLPVLLDFWAAWCGPCRMIAPVVDQIAKDLSGKIRVGKLNVDENQLTAARFRVQSIPTLLILKNGQEVDRLIGLQSKEALIKRLQAYL